MSACVVIPIRREERRPCPKHCSECPGEKGEHHYDQLGTFDEEEPEHPAAVRGVGYWHACRHCDAWTACTDFDAAFGESDKPPSPCAVCGDEDDDEHQVDDLARLAGGERAILVIPAEGVAVVLDQREALPGQAGTLDGDYVPTRTNRPVRRVT